MKWRSCKKEVLLGFHSGGCTIIRLGCCQSIMIIVVSCNILLFIGDFSYLIAKKSGLLASLIFICYFFSIVSASAFNSENARSEIEPFFRNCSSNRRKASICLATFTSSPLLSNWDTDVR